MPAMERNERRLRGNVINSAIALSNTIQIAGVLIPITAPKAASQKAHAATKWTNVSIPNLYASTIFDISCTHNALNNRSSSETLLPF